MTRLYFTLRGDNEHLARGELFALLEALGASISVECYTMICITSNVESTDLAERIMSRAGYLKEAGVLLGVFDAYSEDSAKSVASIIGKKGAHVSIFKSTVSNSAVKLFLEAGGLKQGVKRGEEYRLMFSSGLVFLGVKKYTVNSKLLEERARIKPFKRSIELTPDIARVLVNLSRANRGDIVLDPFAGTGVVLVEAWSMGIRAVGVDVDSALVRGMRDNVLFFRANSVIIHGDSSLLTYREVDHVATDLPYGRAASTHGAEIKSLYRCFVEKLTEYLSRRGFAVFMTPHWLEDYIDEIIYEHGFRVTERYYNYVHSSLTRVINVVRWI
ncbi:MAG: RsmD family RNA methyltransferase [Desulfurococcaceae archaeon]|nr:RsmD family RNA methyltransferase [Desulfurococcaceae archaeon]